MCAVNNISCFWTPICMFLIHLVGTFPICRSWKNQSIISAAVKNQLLSEMKLPPSDVRGELPLHRTKYVLCSIPVKRTASTLTTRPRCWCF